MRRPALFIMIYAIIGSLFGIYFNNNIIILHLFIIIVVVSNLFIVFHYKDYFFSFFMLVAIIYFFIANNSSMSEISKTDDLAVSGKPVTVEATIIDKLKKYDNSTLYVIKTNNITDENGMYIYKDKVNMYMYIDKNLTIGDVVKFNNVLRLPTPKRNDSDFNQELNYKVKNIKYKVYVSEINIIGHKNSFITVCNSFSNKITEKLYLIYPHKEAGILAAMILGDKTNIDNDIYELYRLAGIVHIIAISGLHISIFAGILLALLKPINIHISNIIVMIFLLFYCIFTGCSVSVVRATIMMYIYIFSIFLGRKYDLLSSTSVACSLLLLINPYYLFDMGFQYSFTAVFAIGFTSEIINRYKIKNKYLNTFIISCVVTLATKPITAYYFYYVNTLDVFVNIIAIALMEVILVFALISIAVSFIYIGIIKLYTIPVVLSLSIIEKAANFSLSIPYSQIIVGYVPLLIVVVLFVMFLSIYNLLMYNKFYSISTIICLIIVLSSFILKYRGFEANFMYVGQGDCTIIRDENKCYLIDAGSNSFTPTGTKILNQLKYEGVQKINGIYISHMDYDHMGAILEIANDITIDNIIISKYCEHNENYFNLIKIANDNNVEVIYTDREYRQNLTDDLSIELVFVDSTATDTNEGSAVYSVFCEDKKILFTGDISKETEEKFIDSDIDADILKVPHHGSKYSASKDFIEKVSPLIAINFAGYNNIYKHPSPETIELYKDMRIPFLSTNQYGMIKIRIDGNKIYYKYLDTKYKPVEELFY